MALYVAINTMCEFLPVSLRMVNTTHNSINHTLNEIIEEKIVSGLGELNNANLLLRLKTEQWAFEQRSLIEHVSFIILEGHITKLRQPCTTLKIVETKEEELFEDLTGTYLYR